VADKAVEDLIRRRLAESFPDDAILGEEGGRSGGSGPVWVVDPIDGTAMFLRGIAYWCVSIALVAEGELELGVIYDPMADEMFAGRRGHGATCNGRAMRVSAVTELAQTVLGVGFSSRRPTAPVSDWLGRLLAAHGEYRQLGAGALMLAHAADGRLEGYYEWHHHPWDALAGLLLNREAGAWTNDFLANDGLYQGNAIFVCPPGLRPALADLIAAAGLPVE
jgi:myo-inositol-1(or 4)-monophosphatase